MNDLSQFVNAVKEAIGGNAASFNARPTTDAQAQNFMSIMKNLYNRINQGGSITANLPSNLSSTF